MTRLHIDRRPQPWAGHRVGIITLEASIPYVPGTISNAETFDFPVRYAAIQGATIDRLLNQADRSLVDPVVTAARLLQADGCEAIAGACGFLALFQQEVADALDIPVLLSSLLQIPLIHAMTRRPVGVITADESRLDRRHLDACGVPRDLPVTIKGMQDQPEFRAAILKECGALDSSLIERETVAVAETLVAEQPEIGAILIECTDLPPYSHAVQSAVRRPVFDCVSLIRWAAMSLRAPRY